MFKEELLKMLVCPVCKEKLKLKENKLFCQKCSKDYLIMDDIPVLLKEEAQDSSASEAEEL
jgi:hypothetical protein